MNEIEKSQDVFGSKNTTEARDAQVEQKEKAPDEKEKKAAAMERVEKVSKEVQNTQKQMKNIMANMQNVVKAVRAIRAQLQLADNDDIPSVKKDEERLDLLKKRLDSLYAELGDLKYALEAEEEKELVRLSPELPEEERKEQAKNKVQQYLRSLGLSE
jgi:uncharacterized protein (UPF0335 family)